MKKVFICAVFLLTGCASSTMRGYINHPISEVMMENGQPDFAFDTGPNQKTFVWKEIKTDTRPAEIQNSRNARGFGNDPSTTTTIQPPEQRSYTCYYSYYTQKMAGDGLYPTDWIVTGFKKPNFACQL